MAPPKHPDLVVEVSDLERRVLVIEKVLDGHDRTPGVLERLRTLEDHGLVETAKRAGVVAVVTLVVTVAPLLAVVVPAVQKLTTAVEAQKTQQPRGAP